MTIIITFMFTFYFFLFLYLIISVFSMHEEIHSPVLEKRLLYKYLVKTSSLIHMLVLNESFLQQQSEVG
jgi:hypothetical protein